MANRVPAELRGRPQSEIDTYRQARSAGLSEAEALALSRNQGLSYLNAGRNTLNQALRAAGVNSVDQLSVEQQADILEAAYPQTESVTIEQLEEATTYVEEPSAGARAGRVLSRALVTGAEAVNDVVDVIGEANAERALFIGSAALGGLPKAAIQFTVGRKIDEFTQELLAPATERLSGLIATNAFDARDSDEYQAVKPASDLVANFTIGVALTALVGIGAKGIVAGVRKYREASERAYAEKARLEYRTTIDNDFGLPRTFAAVDNRKFSDYIFKPGADHGKNKVFESLGYSRADSDALAKVYMEQAGRKFENGLFSPGKLDQYGQRVDIEIELPGIGASAGKTSFLRSGWLIQPDGTIKLNTPFTGFTR